MNPGEENKTSMAVATVPAQNIELTATAPDEIGRAQINLIGWCKRRIEDLKSEHNDLDEAHAHAVKSKWSPHALKRQLDRTAKRIEFYQKMLSALEHGYVIIPNFPVTVFAIRTEKTKPLKMLTTHWGSSHEQGPEGLEQGYGEYKNPFPVVYEKTYSNPTAAAGERKEWTEYWSEEWKDLEFPLTMAKLQIMEATTRAMALKAFDDFGILPGKKHEDPIIVARLKDPRSTKYNQRWVTFMVAWHLNTRDL